MRASPAIPTTGAWFPGKRTRESATPASRSYGEITRTLVTKYSVSPKQELGTPRFSS
jgi:hypothetical protein